VREGLVEGLHANALIIDFGTTGVPRAREGLCAKRVELDGCPVSGGRDRRPRRRASPSWPGAVKRTSNVRCRSFQVVGKNLNHMGPSGSGQVTKLANQLIVAQTIDAVAQALRMAELSGVDSALVRKALLGGFAESRILDLHGDRMVRRDFAPGGRSTLQLKDVRLMCELAESVGLDSPPCATHWHSGKRLCTKKATAQLDHSGLFRMYE